MNGLSLNYGDPVVKDLLNKLSSTLNTLNDNNEKTNLIVGGLLKSEVDFPATDRFAILRQFLLRQIGQKCKIRLQTRRSLEEMVIKHIDGLLDLIVDETTDEEEEKSNSSGEVEKDISKNVVSTFSSTVPTSGDKIIAKAVKTSELENSGEKWAELRDVLPPVNEKKRLRYIKSTTLSGRRLENKIKNIFGEEICVNYFNAYKGFESAISTLAVREWNETTVLSRDLHIKRFAEFLKSKSLPEQNIGALLISLDMAFDKIVRPGITSAQTTGFPFPPPGTAKIIVRKERVGLDDKCWSFEPRKIYYEMRHFVNCICSQLNIVQYPVKCMYQDAISRCMYQDPKMPSRSIGSIKSRNKARKSTNVNVLLPKSVTKEPAEVAISSSAQVTDDVDILNVVKKLPESITIDDDNEMPKTVGKMKPSLPKSNIHLTSKKQAKKLKYVRNLENFFGEEVFDCFCQVTEGFESEITTHAWAELAVLSRDVWRKRFVEFLKPKLLPADYFETLLIMLDVRFDQIVRPGVKKAETANFYYPPPDAGRILLRNPTAEKGHTSALQFEPTKLYYEMCHLVGRVCEKLNIDPNPV